MSALSYLKGLLSSRDARVREPSGVTLESLKGRPCMQALPPVADRISFYSGELIRARARVAELELLVDALTDEQRAGRA